MLRNDSKMDVVIRVVEGESEQRELVLEAGSAIAPLAIGRTRGWRIEAREVAEAHVMLAWSGTSLFVGASRGETALLDGFPLGPRWTEVRMPSELCFGGARLSIGRRAGPEEVTAVPDSDEITCIAEPGAIAPAALRRIAAVEAVTCMDEERLRAAIELARAEAEEATCIAAVDVPAAALRGGETAAMIAPIAPPIARPVNHTMRMAPIARRPTLRPIARPAPSVPPPLPQIEASEDEPGSMPPTIPSDGLMPAAAPAYSTPFAVVVTRPSSPTIAIPQPPPLPLPVPRQSSSSFDDSSRAVAGAATPAGPSDTSVDPPREPFVVERSGLVGAWLSASLPRKAIAVLMAPAVLGALFVMRTGTHISPRSSDAGRAEPVAAKPMVAQSPGPPKSVAAPQPAATPSAPTPSSPIEAPKAGVAAVRDTRSAERRALDAAASGQDAAAAEQYAALSQANPESVPFREAARILAERAASRQN